MTHNGKRIIIKALPDAIKQLQGISLLQNDCYIIGIDQALPDGEYKHILGHELAHIFLNHLDNLKPGERTTAEQEREADNRAIEFYNLFADQNAPQKLETRHHRKTGALTQIKQFERDTRKQAE